MRAQTACDAVILRGRASKQSVSYAAFWKQYMYTYCSGDGILMIKARKCVICGTENGCGTLLMGQYVCLDCQTLLDDPHKRVFGCPHNRCFARPTQGKHAELVKGRD